jgi:hypothetical protein
MTEVLFTYVKAIIFLRRITLIEALNRCLENFYSYRQPLNTRQRPLKHKKARLGWALKLQIYVGQMDVNQMDAVLSRQPQSVRLYRPGQNSSGQSGDYLRVGGRGFLDGRSHGWSPALE